MVPGPLNALMWTSKAASPGGRLLNSHYTLLTLLMALLSSPGKTLSLCLLRSFTFLANALFGPSHFHRRHSCWLLNFILYPLKLIWEVIKSVSLESLTSVSWLTFKIPSLISLTRKPFLLHLLPVLIWLHESSCESLATGSLDGREAGPMSSAGSRLFTGDLKHTHTHPSLLS